MSTKLDMDTRNADRAKRALLAAKEAIAKKDARLKELSAMLKEANDSRKSLYARVEEEEQANALYREAADRVRNQRGILLLMVYLLVKALTCGSFFTFRLAARSALTASACREIADRND